MFIVLQALSLVLLIVLTVIHIYSLVLTALLTVIYIYTLVQLNLLIKTSIATIKPIKYKLGQATAHLQTHFALYIKANIFSGAKKVCKFPPRLCVST